MKVLVTGSSGFIGSALVENLRADGQTAFGIDVREPRWRRVHLDDRLVDITDAEALETVLRQLRPQAIVHLAARTDISGETVVNYRANIDGVINLLRAAREIQGVERVLWVSTQLVSKVGRIPRYDTDFDPDTSYGESKVIGERIVRGLDGGGLQWAILRPTTVWGPGMSDHYLSLLRYLEARRYFHVGDAAVRKSFSYIGNAVSQIVALLSAPTSKIHQQTFYVADYEPITLRVWCDDLARALGVSPAPVVHAGLARLLARGGDFLASTIAPKFKFTTFRLHNIMTPYVFDTSNLQAITGPLPFDAHAAIEQTVNWYREVARPSPLRAV